MRNNPAYYADPLDDCPDCEEGKGVIIYTVQPNDNLSTIAAVHYTTVLWLVQMNNISNPNSIDIGQQLMVGFGSYNTGSRGLEKVNLLDVPIILGQKLIAEVLLVLCNKGLIHFLGKGEMMLINSLFMVHKE